VPEPHPVTTGVAVVRTSDDALADVLFFSTGASLMDAADFRRIALSMEGAQEGSHMGVPDFRVEGRIFATLASEHQGYGNLILTPEQQAEFVAEMPHVFLPIPGGWGRMGATHIRLAAASEEVLEGAVRTAWKSRVEKNARARKRPRRASKA